MEATLQESGREFGAPPRELGDSSSGIRLNLGAGDTNIPGFTNLDLKTGDNVKTLLYPDNSVDEIYASHVLEHIDMAAIQPTLNEWARALKPGGRLRIAVPDLEWWAKEMLAGRCPNLGYLYGGQVDANDYHKCGFNYGGLSILLMRAGLTSVQRFNSCVEDCSSLPCSLNVEGIKPMKVARKLVAVMSLPGLTHSDNSKCVYENMIGLGIPMHTASGAYWHQCIERILDEEAQKGAEWIVTVDYDSIWTKGTLERLMVIMESNPDIDALAPLQPKRQEDACLLRASDPNPRGADELIKCEWAHFGLTILRVSALQKVRRPWFNCEPDKDGKWGDGRIDADIGFWKKWHEAGNSLYVASRVPLGHMQRVVTWPGEDGKNVHQWLGDFWDNGTPKGVRC